MMREIALAVRFPLALAVLLYFAANILTSAQTCRLEQLPQCPEYLK